jgi:hypothetical protein
VKPDPARKETVFLNITSPASAFEKSANPALPFYLLPDNKVILISSICGISFAAGNLPSYLPYQVSHARIRSQSCPVFLECLPMERHAGDAADTLELALAGPVSGRRLALVWHH